MLSNTGIVLIVGLHWERDGEGRDKVRLINMLSQCRSLPSDKGKYSSCIRLSFDYFERIFLAVGFFFFFFLFDQCFDTF